MKKEIQSKQTEILSTLKYLFPEKTTEAEILMLQQSEMLVEELGNNRFTLFFKLTDPEFQKVEALKMNLEINLLAKARVVFRVFPGAEVLSVRIDKA
jgi:hypothetical protein